MTDDKRRVHIYIKRLAAAEKERDQLNTELLNTKELSSKLVEENAALKAEVERLKRCLK